MSKAVLFFFLISLSTSFAQEESADSFSNQMGASVSSFSGLGINYHRMLSDNYRVKISGFYLRDGADHENSSTDVFISAGIEGQKNLYKNKTIRVYVLLGVGFIQQAGYDYPAQGSYSSYNRQENTFTGGAGVGMELLAVGRVTFNFDVGLTYSFLERKYYTIDGTAPPVSPQYRSEISFGVGGGFGLGYQF